MTDQRPTPPVADVERLAEMAVDAEDSLNVWSFLDETAWRRDRVRVVADLLRSHLSAVPVAQETPCCPNCGRPDPKGTHRTTEMGEARFRNEPYYFCEAASEKKQ